MTSQEIVEDQLHHFESYPQVIVKFTFYILMVFSFLSLNKLFNGYFVITSDISPIHVIPSPT